MQAVRILIIFGFTIVLTASAQNKERWKKIENNSFSFSVPVSFRKTAARGTDSFVEEYVTKQMNLSFDYGMYSNNFEGWPANTKFETVTINGKAARIGTVAQAMHTGYPYSTQVYIKISDGLALSMFAACKTEDQVSLARKIFETIFFKAKPA